MQNTLTAPITVELPIGILAALPTLKKAHNRKSYVPILANVLLVCDGQTLALSSTDLEIAARYSIALETPCAPFATTLPLVDFADAVKGAQIVALTVSGERCTLKIDGAVREMFTMPAADYPPFPVSTDARVGNVTGTLAELQEALLQVARFASDDEARGAVMMGTLLESKGGAVRAVSTDGYRLGLSNRPNLASEHDLSVILPSGLASILRTIKQKKGTNLPCAAEITEKIITITAGPWKIAARLVDGQYPNYQMVLQKYDHASPRIIVNRKALIAIAKQAEKAAGDRAGMIKVEPVKSASAGDTLRFTAESDTSGKFDGSMQVETHNPFPCMAFNARYLVDIAEAFTADRLMLASSGPLSPMMIFDGEHKETNTFAVLMPLRQ